jgi:RNA methyltransferase, TrmH family
MLSRNRLKLYSSLRYKKYRDFHGIFLAEGEKIVADILSFNKSLIRPITLLAKHNFFKHTGLLNISSEIETIELSDSEFKRISSLTTPNNVILVCSRPDYAPDYKSISRTLSIYLENIRDPGNLGTIIRTADWFGISHVFCSKESVDIYNPKAIQSSMGSICKIRVYYENADEVISSLQEFHGYRFYGTVLGGKNIYEEVLDEKGLIFFGNESHGLSAQLLEKLNIRLTIPPQTDHNKISESLNIAIAASIIMAEFRRRPYSK